MGRAPVLTSAFLERAALSLGVIVLFLAGYFGIGLAVDRSRAIALGTPLDARIPFIASSVWIYLWAFPAAFLPLFVVRCPRLFRRTLLAYAAAIGVSVLFFAAMPVTSAGLRADPGSLDPTETSPRAVALLYRLDPPVNLFPSLHLSIAVLAASSAWLASRSYGAAAYAGVALLAVSICTVKQHFVVDGLAGIALALALNGFLLRSYRPEAGHDPAYGRGGPLAYAALLAAFYGAIYAGVRLV